MKKQKPKYHKWEQVENPSTHPTDGPGIILENPEYRDKSTVPGWWYRIQFPDRPAILHPEKELRKYSDPY